ncbi:MAG: hypothetical protein ACREUV_04540 [Burkholderiales bacterium]
MKTSYRVAGLISGLIGAALAGHAVLMDSGRAAGKSVAPTAALIQAAAPRHIFSGEVRAQSGNALMAKRLAGTQLEVLRDYAQQHGGVLRLGNVRYARRGGIMVIVQQVEMEIPQAADAIRVEQQLVTLGFNRRAVSMSGIPEAEINFPG